MLITGKEDVAALNALYQQREGFGERHIPPKGERERQQAGWA